MVITFDSDLFQDKFTVKNDVTQAHGTNTFAFGFTVKAMLVMRKGLLLVRKHYLLSSVFGLNKTKVTALENERYRFGFFFAESFVCRLHQSHKTS